MNKSTRNLIFVITLVILFLIGGCSSTKTPSGSKTEYGFVLDWSASTANTRKKQIAQIFAELDQADPSANVRLYRMASMTQEIFSGKASDIGVDAVMKRADELSTKSDGNLGTDFAEMAEALERFERESDASNLKLRVLTDGQDDYANDPAHRAAYRSAATKVTSDPRLDSLVFEGVQPGFREPLREVFKNAGSKLQILGVGESLEG